jgi:hypothetical protein
MMETIKYEPLEVSDADRKHLEFFDDVNRTTEILRQSMGIPSVRKPYVSRIKYLDLDRMVFYDEARKNKMKRIIDELNREFKLAK